MSKVTIKNALVKVNEARQAIGFEPLDKMPKGILSSAGACPVHNAFGDVRTEVLSFQTIFSSRSQARKVSQVWGMKVRDLGKGNDLRWAVQNPHEIENFIYKFDGGGFKTLIASDLEETVEA